MKNPGTAPPRLVDGDSRLGSLLRDVPEPTNDPGRRARVWEGLLARRRRGTRRLWWLLAPALALAAATVGLVFVSVDPREPAAPPSAIGTLALTAGDVTAGGAAARAGMRLTAGAELSTAPRSRAVVVLDSRARVVLEAGSIARLDNEGVALGRGRVVASVASRSTASPFVIGALGHRIEVVGTLFAVSVGATEVRVEVTHGTVRVDGRDEVKAGQCWSSGSARVEPCRSVLEEALHELVHEAGGALLSIDGPPDMVVAVNGVEIGTPPIGWWAPAGTHHLLGRDGATELSGEVQVVGGRDAYFRFEAPALAPPPVGRTLAPETARSPEAPVRSELERARALYERAVLLARLGRYAEAAAAFDQVLEQNAPQAELALYELARIRQRHLGDLLGAETALEAYQRRFPDGVLRQEVDLTLIEIRLGRDDRQKAALEIDAFLARYPTSERRDGVRLLGANVARESGDCARALVIYEELQGSPSVAQDALYFAATCEAALGDDTAARSRLEAYLVRFPTGRHSAAANHALER